MVHNLVSDFQFFFISSFVNKTEICWLQSTCFTGGPSPPLSCKAEVQNVCHFFFICYWVAIFILEKTYFSFILSSNLYITAELPDITFFGQANFLTKFFFCIIYQVLYPFLLNLCSTSDQLAILTLYTCCYILCFLLLSYITFLFIHNGLKFESFVHVYPLLTLF